MSARPLVIANWKMNLAPRDAVQLGRATVDYLSKKPARGRVVVCPSAEALSMVSAVIRSSRSVMLGAQNCAPASSGAYTGETSPSSLKNLGCRFVLIGHSERRLLFHETEDLISKKIASAIRAKLSPVLCIGETSDQRAGGATKKILREQLGALAGSALGGGSALCIAYEPVWAIGSGTPMTSDEFSSIRAWIADAVRDITGASVPVLYGGSVTPETVRSYCAVGDGVLVGNASQTKSSLLRLLASV